MQLSDITSLEVPINISGQTSAGEFNILEKKKHFPFLHLVFTSHDRTKIEHRCLSLHNYITVIIGRRY